MGCEPARLGDTKSGHKESKRTWSDETLDVLGTSVHVKLLLGDGKGLLGTFKDLAVGLEEEELDQVLVALEDRPLCAGTDKRRKKGA